MDVADLGDAVNAKWIETWDVPDAAQGDAAHFRAVRDLLTDRIEALLERYSDGRQAA
jgi:protein-tyrosine-phosphatase